MEEFDPGGPAGWVHWLREHHLDRQGVWLIFHRQNTGTKSISYSESLDGALAYGWIDSIIRKLDDTRYARKFTPRRPGSVWSKSNSERVQELLRQGKMTRWGLDAYEKRNGEVSLLERFSKGEVAVPAEFEAALRLNQRAWKNYQRMAPSYRRRYLLWISGAKRPETRRKRIAEAVQLIAENSKDLLK
ncbi:MAG TPA: YdeI/OmpD-associated family protein [Nitrososphaerales archaeon]|nr:YdeI/OmpD-associated family protein [Nitrososphaerales archaeon]